ncbi:MAG: GAF domain-containing sensor histidine kinase [Burkholderiaceae bacterium]|nr:GAF domain-containing sensor histidine kinase [Burkholderiaceae bacterium]
MNIVLRYLGERGLVLQVVLAGSAATAVSAGVAAAVDAAALPPWPMLAAGAAATAAAAGVARIASAALARTTAAAAAIAAAELEADTPALARSDSSDDLHRTTVQLRKLVAAFRARLRLLIAQNVALGQQLKHRTHELNTLQDLSIGLANKGDLGELVDEALGALEQTLTYASASVWARREPQRDVVLLGYRSGDGEPPLREDLRGMRLSRSHQQAYEQIERERVPRVDNDSRISLLSWLWSKVVEDSRTAALYRGTRAWIGLPLRVRDEVLGVLRIDHRERDYFDADRVRLLTAVGSQAALAMRHARLLAQQRDAAVMAERIRIARELHDAVSQTLFAAHVLAGTLAQQSAAGDARIAEQAARLERLNRSALAEMRLLMFELRSDALESSSLAELLGYAAEALACRETIAVDLRADPRADARLASQPAARVHLYRIAQEALVNVLRHAGARRVTIESTLADNGQPMLSIADDGCGFDPSQPRAGHFGLEHMATRAREIGARLQIDSGAGRGTHLRVTLGAEQTDE